MSQSNKPSRLRGERVTMAHAGGGKAMRDLIDEIFVSAFGVDTSEDQARLVSEAMSAPGARLAFTTDGFVVTPLEFPGGDIGKLAICGTVNDLAVGGAKPLWLSAAFIIEEGFELSTLRRLVSTMAEEAQRANVRIVTGDTKVVERGSADGLYIITSGVGVLPPDCNLAATNILEGDVAIINGLLGDHGAAILDARGDLELSTTIQSDCQPLASLMQAAMAAAPNLRAARDLTRGGLASALNEMAESAQLTIEIEEDKVPIRDEVRGMCEILGLDPLYLANEGTLVLFVPESEAEAVLAAMRAHEAGRDALVIGTVRQKGPIPVTMKTLFGGSRVVDMLVGEQLPRIC